MVRMVYRVRTDDYLLTLFRDKNKMSSGEKLPLHFLKNNTGIKWK